MHASHNLEFKQITDATSNGGGGPSNKSPSLDLTRTLRDCLKEETREGEIVVYGSL